MNEILDRLDNRQNGTQAEVLKTEVVAKSKRRQHSADYKLRILRELFDESKGGSEVERVFLRW
jgi:hypothetical protein